MQNLEIVNVVATADLRQQVDLFQVSRLSHIIYDPKIYGGRVAYLKTPHMNGKVTIFPSGKLISVGSKSLEQAQADLEKTVEKLLKSGIINPISVKANIRNIVAVYNLGRSIDIESLSISTAGVYEPEQFPGMIIRHVFPKVTYLVFNSGKVVLTGNKNEKDLKLSAEKIVEIVDTFM